MKRFFALSMAFLCLVLLCTGCTPAPASGTQAAQPQAALQSAGDETPPAQESAQPQSLKGFYTETNLTPAGLLAADARFTGLLLQPDGAPQLVYRTGNGLQAEWLDADTNQWTPYDTEAVNSLLETLEFSYIKAALLPGGGGWLAVATLQSGVLLYHINPVGDAAQISLGGIAFAGPGSWPTAITLTGDGNACVRIAYGETTGWVWASPGGEVTQSYTEPAYPVASVLHDGQIYTLPSAQSTLRLLNPQDQNSPAQASLPAENLEITVMEGATLCVQPGGAAAWATASGIFTLNPATGEHTAPVTSRGYAYAHPGFTPYGMVAAAQNDFVLAGYVDNTWQITRYRYDGEAEYLAGGTLLVWALEESAPLQAALYAFVKANPAWDVVLELGRDGADSDAFTTGDSIRGLNLRLLAGDAPDVLILDGLPMAGYLQNGLFMDITKAIPGEGLYQNLLGGYSTDEAGTYAVPALAILPVLLQGQPATPAQSAPATWQYLLDTLTPGNTALDSWRDLFNATYPAYSGQIFPDGGEVNESALREYLECTAALANTLGISAEYSAYASTTGNGRYFRETQYSYSRFAYDDFAYQPQTEYGLALAYAGYDLTGLFFNRGRVSLRPLPGGGYIPVCIASVPKDAQNPAAALSFITTMLEAPEVQTSGSLSNSGFAVQQGVLEQQIAATLERYNADENSSFAANPGEYDWDVFLGSFTTPAITDTALQETLYSTAMRLYAGQLTLDDAVAEAQSSTRLYFEERRQ